jgi:hypothetical protein
VEEEREEQVLAKYTYLPVYIQTRANQERCSLGLFSAKDIKRAIKRARKKDAKYQHDLKKVVYIDFTYDDK